jgi:hypothetical protein
METCTEEVGLLKKKPCGKAKVTQCASCEQPLCSEHAVPQVTPGGKKTGKFMCKEHYKAWLEYEKDREKAASGKSAAPAAAPRPAAPAAAAPKPAPVAAKPQPAAAAAAEKKEEKPFKPEDTGPLEFTPTKKP